ncbi:MAG: helix-turn-helix domain-containing protein [Caldilineaceae bacterium]|nr:helix-turn-helix domain-containing protein [Caldilineaceae bacterium]
MSLQVEQRLSDSPYIETVMQGHSLAAGSTIRPAETHWHMVFVREAGKFHPLVVGPWRGAGVAEWQGGGEILWVQFKLGVFMPHLPFDHLLDNELRLPEGAGPTFRLKSDSWELPTAENVETFVARLIHNEILVHDPLVGTVLADEPHDFAPRTVRHRFQRATGLSPKQIQQVARAQQAAALLQQGVSILDTIYEAGYYDQSHLTRALRQWVGYTPAQILQTPPEPQIQTIDER